MSQKLNSAMSYSLSHSGDYKSILILVNINYNIMKLCGVFTILNLCKTDLKIACLLNLVVVGS